jgi:pimeloyl-ACP methyl ester carboxylesterase
VRHFGRRYRCITFNARGWTPSEVPQDVAAYSQVRARDDIKCVLDHLKIDKAHVAGLSMGGFATLHFGLAYPDRAHSLVVAGVGYGAEKDQRERFRSEAVVIADKLEKEGMAAFAAAYAYGPTRVQFENKDPRGFAEFKQQLSEHSAKGAANTQLGVQRERPSIFDLEPQLRKLEVPTLILNGDEDWPCLLPSVFMKRMIRSAALQLIPNTGHTINIEEPDAFNAALAGFWVQVDARRWPMRDPRAVSQSITGMTK